MKLNKKWWFEMDLTPTIVPKSDQLNADDLMAGPITVTIVEVAKGTPEQPANVVTKEFGPKRPYKPSKSMRRVLVTGWGVDTSTYSGRSLTLFRNPTIRFGPDEVGGIQISHMSNLDAPLTVALTVSRGKRAPFIVEPLKTEPVKDTSGRDWLKELSIAGDDLDAITALGGAARVAHAPDQVIGMILAEYKRVQAEESK